MEEITSVLLQELRSFREELREFKDEVSSWKQDIGERLVKVETVVKPALMSNGQPSQISTLDIRVSSLEKSWAKLLAITGAVWAAITFAAHWIPWGRH